MKGQYILIRGQRVAVLILTSVLLWVPCRVGGQALSGSIVGTVTDQSGAVVPAAKITLTETATGFVRAAVANGSGQYVAYNIPTGNYTIAVEASGFEKLVRSGIQLNYGQTVTVDLQVAVGSTSQTVQVNASAPLLQMQTGGISFSVANQQTQELPLNGRYFTSLLLVAPGTYAATGDTNLIPSNNAYALMGGTNYDVNGSLPSSNSYLLDGLYNRGLWLNTLVMAPVLDSIQDMNVLSNGYDAEYGSSAGAVTIVETKSGTNQFHGDAFEYVQNTSLNANNFFNNRAGLRVPPYHYNQFGGTFGGPIRRDKTFFFADYQGTRTDLPQTATSTIPTLAQQQMVETGNFSGLGTTIYNPYSVTTNAQGQTVRNQFQGNMIPSGMLDPAAIKVIALLPTPQTSGATNNFTFNPPQTVTGNQVDARIDQNLGVGDRLFAKYGFVREVQVTPGLLPAPANSSIPVGPYLSEGSSNTGATAPMQNQSMTVDYVKSIGPGTVNDAQVGILRWTLAVTPLDEADNAGIALGMPGINITNKNGGIPGFLVSGFQTIGNGSGWPEDSYSVTYQYDDNLTLVRGRHTLKFGGVYLRNDFNGFSATGTPQYSFNGQFTRQIGTSTTATDLADFALGVPSGVTRVVQLSEFGMRFGQLGGYAEDAWRVNSRITLNYGVRYDLFPQPTEVHDHWANLNLQTGLLKVAGINGNGRRLVNTDPDCIAPRLGLAYALTSDRKTVFRAGFGESYVVPNAAGGQLYKNQPFYFTQTVTTDQNGIPSVRISDGLPVPTPLPVTNTAGISTGSPNGVDPNLQAEKALQISGGVQRQLQPNLMLSVSFVRTRTLGIEGGLNLNQSVPGAGAQGPRQPYYGINPNLVAVNVRSNWANASYNALQVLLEKRYSKGLSFNLSYTWSQFLSDGQNINGGGNWTPQNNLCIRCIYGPMPESRDQVLVFNHVYQVPLGPGRKFVNHGVAGYVLGNWDVDGIWTAMTSQHFTPTLSTTVSNSTGGGAQRPNRVCDGNLSGSQRTLSAFFNTACFVAPAQYTYGNGGSGILLGPGFFNADLGIHRVFPLWERYQLVFRAEAFNSFNHANFGNPGASIGTASAGVISSANPARIIQLALKLNF